MRQINVHEAKTHLSRILDDVKAGEIVILAKMGKPYAKLVPLDLPAEVPMGFLSGEVGVEIFNPLADEELADWHREIPL